MLMAAGVKVRDTSGQCYEIVPIVIDPDHAAADLTRTVKLMRDYKKVRNRIDFNTASANTFFANDINLNVFSEHSNITMNLGNTQDTDFKTYIGWAAMQEANSALASMLFSDNNLNSMMDVGFKGNPNIGSVVLNQFAASTEFRDFAASFAQNDRIFIISSIFGGTGASGFPLLLKNLRAISNNINGNGLIKKAPIGAVSVFPYFEVSVADNSQINSSTFISKTKAALSYYDKNMTEANILYYIGDNVSKQYDNSEGGTTQQNDAHFIELAAALAIVDFAQIPDDQLNTKVDSKTNTGVPETVEYKEFGIIRETSEIIFSDMDIVTQTLIKKPMTQFFLFCKYMNEQIASSTRQTWAISNNFDSAFLCSAFYQSDLSGIKDAYLEWLAEMSKNHRAFTPYELKTGNNLFRSVKGEKPKKTWFKDNYVLFDATLNNTRTNGEPEHRFVELFYKATEKLVKRKFNM
jgi:hypothetical protein